MQTLRADVGGDGAVVNVEVNLPLANVLALRQGGHPVPAAVTHRALIDCGADVSFVTPQVLAPLLAAGLQHTRFHFVNAPAFGGLTVAIEYAIGLVVVHPSLDPRANLVLRSLPVIERSLGLVAYDVLLGRDVLDRCVLVYDGPGRAVTLAY